MKVLVTGASGFVGAHLCRELVRRGIPVRGTVRGSNDALPAGVESVRVRDLDDTSALSVAVEGVTSVVHLAARVHVMRDSAANPLAEFRRVNVEGTRNVALAAANAGVQRFLFLSSVKVNGEGVQRPYRESDPPAPEDPYAISKLEAEQFLATSNLAPNFIVLRSPLVYGPGVGGNFLRLLSLAHLSRRIPLPLGAIHNARSLVYVENLTDAIVHLLGQPVPQDRCFLVADDEALSTTELIRRIARLAGSEARLWPCPRSVVRLAAAVLGARKEADRLLDSLTVDITCLRKTGWRPPVTVDVALERTLSWWLTG